MVDDVRAAGVTIAGTITRPHRRHLLGPAHAAGQRVERRDRLRRQATSFHGHSTLVAFPGGKGSLVREMGKPLG